MRIQIDTVNKPLTIFSYSSLTDIVLLLLIFFLLTSSFIATSGLKVNLPAATATQPMDKNRVVITLLSGGGMLVNDAPVTADSLGARLHRELTDPANQVVMLASDKDVALDRAVFVLDAARRQGASRFFISTKTAAAGHDLPK